LHPVRKPCDGSDLKTLLNEGRKFPRWLVLNATAGHITWTMVGDFKANDGSIKQPDFMKLLRPKRLL
jgi:hypothetical protein